jgi:hypothetical protein
MTNGHPPGDDDDDDDTDLFAMPIDLGTAKDTVEMSTDEINAAIEERERAEAEEKKKTKKKEP